MLGWDPRRPGDDIATEDEESLRPHRPKSAAKRATVLVVDHEPGVRDGIARLLKDAGYAVNTASDGVAALTALKSEVHDVIVSDITMPGMDGIAWLSAVREVDLDVPIVLLTGRPSLQTAKQAIELGAFRYLTKPVNPEELDAVVRRALVAHRMARLKRDALAAVGADMVGVGDMAGLQVSFDRALMKLWIAYHPIVRSVDGALFGYEALLRSDQPALPSPDAVLRAAERLGRVRDLGRVVRTRILPALDRAEPNDVFFVNLHPQELLDDDLLLPDSPLSAHARRIVLEVTERASIIDVNEVRDRVGRLRAMGFQIAVDDLGAGYAGLTSFAILEPEFVKLDIALTRDVDTNATKQQIVRAMVQLCQETATLVVAEGIETLSERDAVASLGCDLVQGYFVAKPGRTFPERHW